MRTSRTDTPTGAVLTLSGEVATTDTRQLGAELVDAFDAGGQDLFLDAHGVTGFEDEALAALVVGRARAKAGQHRLVILDVEDGPVAQSLRRTGLLFRFPVFADSGAAAAGLSADRAAVALRAGVFGRTSPDLPAPSTPRTGPPAARAGMETS
ncbi:STAS domain-containing protein [Motilibacter aurantiacus]|uniref:STAS domain-containing protein n=1 Tax=Motilibacter aurantiacus TaxID=2714955 RepID=UPI00140E353F|nr:STAS domain-containing protein [Motilibacter aurantiacus]NHC46930.1 STAS domain-containing protein [Motilibacter aurantiacus]